MTFGRPPAPPDLPSRPKVILPGTEGSEERASTTTLEPAAPADRVPLVLPPIAAPPRMLPLELWLHLLLGTVLARAGWGLVILGSLILAAMAPYTDVIGLLLFPGSSATIEGTVQEVTVTDWSDLEIGNVGQVFANRFLFTPPGGATVEAVSYSTGRVVEAGQPVTIQYNAGNPFRARILNQRFRPLGRSSAVLLLPMLVGFVLVGRAIVAGLAHARLLQRGLAALAVLRVRKERCDRQGRVLRWNLEFSFQTPDGRLNHLTFQTRDSRPVEDDAEEVVFYDPALPDRGVLFDALPGRPSLDADGSFQVPNPLAAWMSVLPGALAILMALATLWYLLRVAA
jgi:hypothetical protein